MIVRLVRPDDASGINEIYNPYILESPATFETMPITLEGRRRWIDERLSNRRWPAIVAENEGGEIAGFANAAAFDPRAAYETSVKTSIFIAPAARAKGVGAKLYSMLFDRLAAEDVHRAYAGIVTPNPASIALHQRFSFRQIATYDEVGRKFGRYYSVMWFEKRF